MRGWFEDYWWMIWGVGCSAAWIVYQLRHTPGDDPETGEQRSVITRIFDPDGEREKALPQRLLLMGAGLLVVVVFIGLLKLYEWAVK